MPETRIDPRARTQSILAETSSAAGMEMAAAPAAGQITISLTNDSGRIALNWTNTGAIGKYDYVALYDNPPADPYGYLTNQWQWVTVETGIYPTDTQATGGTPYWIAYGAWDYGSGAYVLVQTAGPFRF